MLTGKTISELPSSEAPYTRPSAPSITLDIKQTS